jgi:hypothetical protein
MLIMKILVLLLARAIQDLCEKNSAHYLKWLKRNPVLLYPVGAAVG